MASAAMCAMKAIGHWQENGDEEDKGNWDGCGGRIIMQAACAIIVLLSFPLYVSPAARWQEAWPRRANECSKSERGRGG